MLRPWHAIRPLRREVLRTKLHVPSVENERLRISLLHHRTLTSESQEKQSPVSSKLTIPPSLQGAASKANVEASSVAKGSEATAAFQPNPKHKTVREADAELLAKLEGISGEGGVAGVEYEGGKAVGLKRGVRDNMFRVI